MLGSWIDLIFICRSHLWEEQICHWSKGRKLIFTSQQETCLLSWMLFSDLDLLCGSGCSVSQCKAAQAVCEILKPRHWRTSCKYFVLQRLSCQASAKSRQSEVFWWWRGSACSNTQVRQSSILLLCKHLYWKVQQKSRLMYLTWVRMSCAWQRHSWIADFSSK